MAVGEMSSGRWYRRKAMATGTTEEKPCPSSRANSNAAASTAARAVDDYAQARKVLAERSPFEEPEEIARVPTLPVGLATALLRSSDFRRKHKKLLSDSVKKAPPAHQAQEAWSLWTETDEYFRPIALADLDLLESRNRGLNRPFLDSSLTIPKKIDGCSSEETEGIGELGVDNSVNWILGSRQRSLVASERPSKKRKLMAGDAELRRLMRLPSNAHGGSRICDFCCSGHDDDPQNRLITCGSCKISVHMKCYGVRDAVLRDWLCSWCSSEEKDAVGSCVLCPKKGGALKIVGLNMDQRGLTRKYAHLFCSLWIPEVVVGNVETMEPILNADGVLETSKRHVCSICKVKQGACIRCGHGSCQAHFHPACARDTGLRMEVWGKGKSNDVELLAFCAKHSCLQDNSSVQAPENLSETDHDHSLSLSSTSKVPRIRITCKGRETRSGKENPGAVFVSGNGVLSEGCGNVSMNEEIVSDERSCDMDNGSSDIKDLLMILKKLSERGKLKLSEVAVELGISLEVLESIIRGQTTSLSSELKLKIIKWFRDYVHLGGPVRQLAASSSDSGVSGAAGANVEDSGAPGSVLFKSLPSRRRTKNEVTVMKDHRTVCPGGDDFSDEDCVKLVNNDNASRQNIGIVENDSPTQHESDYSNAVRKILRKMEGVSRSSEVSSLVARPQQCDVANSGNGDVGEPLATEVTASKITKPSLGARVHPFIEEKLNKINHVLRYQEEATDSMETDLSMKNCSNVSARPLNDTTLDQAAMCADILETSPEDELEGEVLYLQNKLLDTVVIIKQRCEKLMQSITKLLPAELNSLKKQRWDLVAVNQYMRQLKEAKKRGRKEKRHKEYQAVLAAATAATETSSRGSTHRKEKMDGLPSQQEESAGGRPGVLVSQAKEDLLKLATPKVTPEKRADAHEDLCDICGRPETMLSRIFICGGCKVPVHLDCYRRPKNPISSWSCEACEESSVAQCGLCGVRAGAFRKASCGRWVHNICAEWILQSTFKRGQEKPVEGLEAILSGKESVSCDICHQRTGVCIKCAFCSTVWPGKLPNIFPPVLC
ncbi:uncharacterized protein LOC144704267 isoform X2 [Wolffia australiana]